VSRYQKGKTNLDFTEARDSEWQWHLAPDRLPRQHPTPQFFTGRMPYLLPNNSAKALEANVYNHISKMRRFNLWGQGTDRQADGTQHCLILRY